MPSSVNRARILGCERGPCRSAFFYALVVSLAIHAGVAVWLSGRPGREHASRRARLDVSSVELSVSESPVETAPPQESALSQRVQISPPKDESPPDELIDVLVAAPSLQYLLSLPEPGDEPVEEMSVPETLQRAAPNQAMIVASPRPEGKIKVEYPNASRRRGEEGEVLVEAAVDEYGCVEWAEVRQTSGSRDLDDAALKAVRQARFSPAISDGRPVGVVVRLPVSFRLKAAR